jgi:DNA-binding XRE family transcriptional regulator
MSKRSALLAKLEQKFGSDQLKSGILEDSGISLSNIPEFQPAQLESVPELLALARTQASLTLAEVAERLGVTRAAVHHRERLGANLEVATLLEQAQVMGYEVRITLRHLETGQVLTTEMR